MILIVAIVPVPVVSQFAHMAILIPIFDRSMMQWLVILMLSGDLYGSALKVMLFNSNRICNCIISKNVTVLQSIHTCCTHCSHFFILLLQEYHIYTPIVYFVRIIRRWGNPERNFVISFPPSLKVQKESLNVMNLYIHNSIWTYPVYFIVVSGIRQPKCVFLLLSIVVKCYQNKKGTSSTTTGIVIIKHHRSEKLFKSVSWFFLVVVLILQSSFVSDMTCVMCFVAVVVLDCAMRSMVGVCFLVPNVRLRNCPERWYDKDAEIIRQGCRNLLIVMRASCWILRVVDG